MKYCVPWKDKDKSKEIVAVRKGQIRAKADIKLDFQTVSQ